MMNSEIINREFLATTGCKVLKNETEVYQAPTTEVIAEAHMTIPKNL